MVRSATDAGASIPAGGTRRRPGQRAVDLAVGLGASVATAPLIAVLLVGSGSVFRANLLFVQHRVGRGATLIPVPKIRTLPPQAPSAADKHELAAVPIPAWGLWLRSWHFDELPQLWSVVAGHMSLVGPRPEMAHLVERFDPEFAAARTTVRPGITGLWQLSEAASGLICEAPEYDLPTCRWRAPGSTPGSWPRRSVTTCRAGDRSPSTIFPRGFRYGPRRPTHAP